MAAASEPPVSGRLVIGGSGQGSGGALAARRQSRLGGAMGLSVAGHLVLLLALMFLVSSAPRPFVDVAPPERLPIEIVWHDTPGEAGGGGGGGQDTQEPPVRIEEPGDDALTLPVDSVPEPTPEPALDPEPEPEPVTPTLRVEVPAWRMAAALTSTPGALASEDASGGVGRGTGPGADGGNGEGIGRGGGPGLDDGTGGNTGGDRAGLGGVTSPVALREVKPAYTAEAMHAKIQGSVLVQCVVRPDGICADLQVVRSLDRRFGLDDEALKAASQWRFAPGTRAGEPVSVAVIIQLDFALR